MRSYQRVKEQFFSYFQGQSPGQERVFTAAEIWDLSQKSGLSHESVREAVVQWASERMITLGSWDNSLWRVRAWQEWSDVNQMFFNSQDGNCVRARLLLAGEEYLQSIARTKIGFLTPSA